MKRYTAFLRGINVGGHKMIKMDALKDAFIALDFKEVSTLIQSGNVIFGGKKTEIKSIRKKIEKMLKETFGHDITAIIRTEDDIKKIISQSLFKKISLPGSGAAGYITLLADEYKNKLKLPLVSPKNDVEVIGMKDNNVYCLSYPAKDGRYGFPNAFVEKELGIPATTRNPNTLNKISEILNSI